MKLSNVLKISLIVLILSLSLLMNSAPLTSFSKPETTFENVQVSAIFDNKKNDEYLYVFDKSSGDIWKYNLDSPAEMPKYIGQMKELGKPLDK